MRAPSAPLVVSGGQRQILERLAGSQSAPHREVTRAKALLLAEQGVANTAIGAALGVAPSSVVGWRKRFESDGVTHFAQVGGRSGPETVDPGGQDRRDRAVDPAGHPRRGDALELPVDGQSGRGEPGHGAAGVVGRGLKPHLVATFKLSSDPKFEEKLIDVVGLYLNPPDQAVVLCMDEKSSAQALDRTQASLPMKKGRAGTMTHDYKRHGTTTLFAALNVLTGVVIGQCLPRHRHDEFLKFLRKVDKEVPKKLRIHMILDNYATHTHPDVKAWLAAHPRFQLHFTPTSSSWLNLVERWFRDITDKAIRRGVFASVPDLITAIETYLNARNADPKPFVWTASAEAILEKVRRGRVALQQTTS